MGKLNMTFTEVVDFCRSHNLRFIDHWESQCITVRLGHITITIDPDKGYFKVFGEDYVSRNFDELLELLASGVTLNSTLDRGSLNVVQLNDCFDKQHWLIRLLSRPFYLVLRKELLK